jgi:hypothetical protein
VNNLEPVVMFMIVGAILLFVVVVAGMTHSHRNRELNNFASSWRGRINRYHAWDHPRVSFTLGDSPAVLDYSSHGDEGTKTHLTITLYDLRLRLELKPQGIAQRLGKYLGMQDIEIGSAAFDSAFIIQGSSERGIRDFLSPNVQAAIFKIARCGTNGRFDLHLQLGSGSLRITKHEHLSSAAELSNFVRCCFELLVQIQKPLSAGIEFVEPTLRQPKISLKDTECQVCGDPLLEKVVFCTKCKTPHHLDCWQYFGSCAVYGCGQKRYIVFRQ